MSSLELADARIYYEDRGTGEPLVLIPGFASGAWSWLWQAGEFAKTFRVISFDPPGVSKSKVTGGRSVTIENIADDVLELLDKLNVEKAHLLGISFGGFVAQEFALRHPSRLKKLVLASTSFGGPDHIPPTPEVLASFEPADSTDTADRTKRRLRQAFLPAFVQSHSGVVERFCDLRESNIVPEEIYNQQLKSAMKFDAGERVTNILAEALILSGGRDIVVPVENAYNLAARLPNSRLEILHDAGHMAFVECAGEFNGLVRDFLIS